MYPYYKSSAHAWLLPQSTSASALLLLHSIYAYPMHTRSLPTLALALLRSHVYCRYLFYGW